MTHWRLARTRLTRWLALLLIAILTLPWPSRAADTSPIRLVSETADELIVVFTLSGYTIDEVTEQGQTFSVIAAEGLPTGGEPGRPLLPQAAVLIGLPPTGQPTVHILESRQTTLSLAHPPRPAAAPRPVSLNRPFDDLYEFAPDPTVYDGDALYPATPSDVQVEGLLRDRRLARLRFFPMRYNPSNGQLEITHHLMVRVQFNPPPPIVPSADQAASPFDHLLDDILLNHRTAAAWRARATADAPAQTIAAWNEPAAQPGSYKITVRQEGLYRLTYADLQSAGLPVNSLDPRTLKLYEQGQEIAIQVSGQDDGIFHPADSLLFYGRVPFSRYTDHNVYWLRYGDAPGLRMSSRPVTPGSQNQGIAWATTIYDENRYYDSRFAAPDGDHWYAEQLRLPDAPSRSATLWLRPTDAVVPTATLQIVMVGYTQNQAFNPDHHARFALNGSSVGGDGLWWDGYGAITVTITVPRSLLQSGLNTVTLTLPGDTGTMVEGMWLDSVSLTYAVGAVGEPPLRLTCQAGERKYQIGGFVGSDIWLYDISDPARPVQLTGATVNGGTLSFADAPTQPVTYLALTGTQIRRPDAIILDTPSNLHSPAHQADYVIIAHADLIAAVQPLAAFHQAQGRQVTVVDVQQIYDEFNGGLLAPSAIREFLTYAYENWASPAPTYVLLVGDGSYDPLDHAGYHAPTLIPPYLAMVDPWWGETAADPLYVAISGNDPLPDMLLGRLPVNTAAEARVVAAKIIQYQQSPYLGDWNAHHVFVADNADAAGNFAQSANAIYNAFIQEPWIGSKIYLDTLSIEAARQAVLSAWQSGALLISFTGHSSWHQWAAESIFDIHTVAQLRNEQRLPVLLSMTCFTGLFQHPEYGTLDESLLRQANGGAVATWSPSGLGIANGHDELHYGLYRAVFNHQVTELGAAIQSAQLYLYSQPADHTNLLYTYHLFGDPAMSLNLTIRPWPFSIYLPLARKTS